LTADLTLILPDRIGSLAHALTIFSAAGIAIRGCAGFPAWAGEGILHVLIDDVEAAREALRAAGIDIREEREVLVTAPLSDTHQAARVLETIAAQGSNIDLIYSAHDARLVVGATRLEIARQALGELAEQPVTPKR
jgi:hypothetical protein